MILVYLEVYDGMSKSSYCILSEDKKETTFLTNNIWYSIMGYLQRFKYDTLFVSETGSAITTTPSPDFNSVRFSFLIALSLIRVMFPFNIIIT